jgi:hypothetical protein
VTVKIPWRSRWANRLRLLADRLDGARSIPLWISTNPPISRARTNDCIQEGMHAIARALQVETDMATIERMMQTVRKDLYEPEKNQS